jgi:hypothetical protein
VDGWYGCYVLDLCDRWGWYLPSNSGANSSETALPISARLPQRIIGTGVDSEDIVTPVVKKMEFVRSRG